MELAAEVVTWFTLVPTFNDNRAAPPEDQLSLEVKRLSQLDLMVQNGWERDGQMEAWRDQRLGKIWSGDGDVWPMVNQLSPDMLRGVRQFCEYTRNFKHFVFNGKEVTEPAELAIRLIAASVGVEHSLFGEINTAINEAAQLSEGALKNFVGQCAGLLPPTSTATDAAAAAAPTPAPANASGPS